MSHQEFSEESNWKHEPWKKNLDKKLGAEDSENEESSEDSESKPVPPGAPDRTPIENPDKDNKGFGDPQPPQKKKPKL